MKLAGRKKVEKHISAFLLKIIYRWKRKSTTWLNAGALMNYKNRENIFAGFKYTVIIRLDEK